MKKLFLLLLPLILAQPSRADMAQHSADYVFTAESTDAGGLLATSADYVSESSAGSGNFATSADYAQRGGYIGQLPNAPMVMPLTIQRGTNSPLRFLISSVTNTVADPDGDSVSVAGWSNTTEEGGSLAQVNSRLLQYTALTGYNGNDTAFWTVLDSEGDESQGTILFRVAMPVDGPSLNMISFNVNGPGATLVFAGFPQATYETQVQVQYTDSLTPPNWQNLGGTVVTNGLLTIVDPTGGSTNQRFYRTVYPSP